MVAMAAPEMQRGLRMSGLTTERGAKHIDTHCQLRFLDGRKELELSSKSVWAVVHNIEQGPKRTSPWRLRRATLVRVPGKPDSWAVEELVFGFRREGVKGAGKLQALADGRKAMAEVFATLLASEAEQAVAHKVSIDLTASVPTVTAEVRARGKGYKKQFFAVESKLLKRDKKTGSVFRDARWRGDEAPLDDGSGSDFTVDFVLRQP
tara:strand:+ start:57709 stop:58329 length:621 start_codon:yes stop_codon:yes gene_type:complete